MIHTFAWEGSKVKKLRIWVNELPFIHCNSNKPKIQFFDSNLYVQTKIKSIALEVFLPSGTGALYGLLGGEVVANSKQALQVSICEPSIPRPFKSGFDFFNNNPYLGLPDRAYDFIFQGIQENIQRPTGISLNFNCFAHGNYSGPIIYQMLSSSILNAISLIDFTTYNIINSLNFGSNWIIENLS